MNLTPVCLTLAAAMLAVSVGPAAAQDKTAPRLIKDGLPATMPQALGGGLAQGSSLTQTASDGLNLTTRAS